MNQLLLDYSPVSPVTWAYLAAFLLVALFFKFGRLWSLRNFDLWLLLSLTPGLLLVDHGRYLQEVASIRTQESRLLRQQDSLRFGDSIRPEILTESQKEGDDGLSEQEKNGQRQEGGAEEGGATNFSSEEADHLPRAISSAQEKIVLPPPPEVQRQKEKGQWLEFRGFLWLFVVGLLFLGRLLVDISLLRRPLTEPNLSLGGIGFLVVILFVVLIGQIFQSESSVRSAYPIETGPGYRLLRFVPSVGLMPVKEYVPDKKNDAQRTDHRETDKKAEGSSDDDLENLSPDGSTNDVESNTENTPPDSSFSAEKKLQDFEKGKAPEPQEQAPIDEGSLVADLGDRVELGIRQEREDFLEKPSRPDDPNHQLEVGDSEKKEGDSRETLAAPELNHNENRDEDITKKGSQSQLGNFRLEDTQELTFSSSTFLFSKLLVGFCQLLIVVGLIVGGYRLIGRTRMGLAAAAFYLLYPYTGQMGGMVDHVLPSALLLWAVLAFRQPLISGLLLGMVAGLVYYPFFLLPLWVSFYWERGLGRFLIGLVSILLLMLFILWLSFDESAHFVTSSRQMFGLLSPTMEQLQGVWYVPWLAVYRLPVLVMFLAISVSFATWPAKKNIGTLLAGSALVLCASQFWHPFGGGLYVAWYLPLLLLVIFRANLKEGTAQKEIAPVRWREALFQRFLKTG